MYRINIFNIQFWNVCLAYRELFVLQNKTSGKIMSSDWVLDPSELTSLFNSRTKAIILNTPHNPIGKVFSQQELELIADLCKKWNVLCIADEVYEWLVYKPYKHIRIGKLLLGHVCVLGNYNSTVFVENMDKNEHFVFISFYSS